MKPKKRAWRITLKDFASVTPEENSGEIVTIPGEAKSIRDLLIRHASGQDISHEYRRTVYDDTDDFDSVDRQEVSRMDLSDLQDAVAYQAEITKAISDEIEKRKKIEEQKVEPGTTLGGPGESKSDEQNSAP